MNPKPIVKPLNPLVLALVALCICAPGPAAAIVLPAPDLVLSGSGAQVGLRTRYFAFANAFSYIEHQDDTVTKFPSSRQEEVFVEGSVTAAGRAGRVTFASWQSGNQPGKLRVSNEAWVVAGAGAAGVTVDMQFMDVLQVDTAGILRLNWSVLGSVNQQILLPSIQAGSSLVAELYVWPFGPLPQRGVLFNFTNYAKSSITAVGEFHLLPTEGQLYPAGSRWWVMGQLSVQSRADATDTLRVTPPYRVATTAEFGNTIELFIAPDPSTPLASFHSASGHDYRVSAIPEPSSGLLWLAGLLALRLFASHHPNPAGCAAATA